MNTLNPNLIFDTPYSELISFEELIKKTRIRCIKKPEDYVTQCFIKNKSLIDNVVSKRNVSEVIHILRESAYHAFLIDEANFNYEVINELSKTFKTPNLILKALIDEISEGLSTPKANELVKDACGKYASLISKFFYVLALSNTQARRSRAGKTFESILYKMYDSFGYSFVSQKQVGTKLFEEKGLGKMVDSLLPGIDAFDSLKSRTIIGTMKTTLRERWQEVVEELSRTGLPKIYLLTMDDDISASKSDSMGEHNVIIVVPLHIKNSEHLADKHNIISFETYFFNEIPPVMEYWRDNPPRRK